MTPGSGAGGKDGPIQEVHAVGPFQANAYILGCRLTGKGIVIDPGDEGEVLIARVRALDLDIEAIALTHGHLDHAGAATDLHEALGAPVLLHEADARVYGAIRDQRRLFGLPAGKTPIPPDRLLRHGEEIRAGEIVLRVIHTPGHTLGSVCFLIEGGKLFSGDTLFRGSIGRTDIGGTSPEELVRSIEERLCVLDDATEVFPGHGEPTTIGIEKRTNPFLRPEA